VSYSAALEVVDRAIRVAAAGEDGVGGLEHLAAQYAQVLRGTVVAVDLESGRLAVTHALGERCGGAGQVDPVAALKELGGLDVAVVLAASSRTFDQAYASLRRGGRLVAVTVPVDGAVMSVPLVETVVEGIAVSSSAVGTRQDLVEVFALHTSGRARVVFDALPARIVFTFEPAPAGSL
jgi:alcohol dehydrogenase, propanol-preferring